MISASDIQHLKGIVDELKANDRYKELLDVIGIPTLQKLNIEAAKSNLSPVRTAKNVLLPRELVTTEF